MRRFGRPWGGLFVHGAGCCPWDGLTGWGVHETFCRCPYGIMTFLWHCYSALGKQFFQLFRTPAVFTACNTLASPTGFRSLWTDAISWENQYRTIASIYRNWRWICLS